MENECKETVEKTEETKSEDKTVSQSETVSEQSTEMSDNSELLNLKAELAKANTERSATLEAIRMGVDPKQIDYVLKLAEFPKNADKKAITTAIQKVLDDVPAFRKNTSSGSKKIHIGAEHSGEENQQSDMLAKVFGNRKHH